MPTYEYACRACGESFEAFQSMRDAPLVSCPKCGQPQLKRLIGRGAGVIFKGSGFYETDYKRTSARKEGGESTGGKDAASAPSTTTPTATASATSSGAAPASVAPAKKE